MNALQKYNNYTAIQKLSAESICLDLTKGSIISRFFIYFEVSGVVWAKNFSTPSWLRVKTNFMFKIAQFGI